jgi:hypothetical protein
MYVLGKGLLWVIHTYTYLSFLLGLILLVVGRTTYSVCDHKSQASSVPSSPREIRVSPL